MSDCQHRKFNVNANVIRLQKSKGFKINGFSMDVWVNCAECEQPFEFMGLPMGLITGGAAMSVDRLEGRFSIQPSTQTEGYLTALKEQK